MLLLLLSRADTSRRMLLTRSRLLWSMAWWTAGRFFENFENLILKISSAAQGKHPRVAIFGEAADLLMETR